MLTNKSPNRHSRRCSLAATVLGLFALSATAAYAADKNASLMVRPHCDIIASQDEDTILGPIPDVDELVSLGDGKTCDRFEVEDPQTLRTEPLAVGDTLDFDIVVENPSKQSVTHVRSWLAYDTNVFEGVSIEVTENFPLVTPGESDFDTENGYVMVEGSNEDEGANTNSILAVARVKLRAKITPPTGTFISFYDVQTGGHTSVNTMENDSDAEILGSEPGGLHVIFAEESAPDEEGAPEDALPPDLPPPPTPLQSAAPPTEPDPVDTDLANSLLDGDAEAPPVDAGPPPFDSLIDPPTPPADTPASGQPEASAERTAFALLQVRNLRISSEGSSIFLAWDDLNSSSLKGYNIYYGTTSGRYIQRKTVNGTMNSIVLRNLPLGETYFVALRAVSLSDEESSFSQEVSVEVGNAATSTAPLVQEGFGRNPVGNLTGNGAVSVPGNTGSASAFALLFLLCAVVGTFIASKRQLAFTTEQPTT